MKIEELKKLREKVNNVDLKIIKLLEKRLSIVHKINSLKEKLKLPLTSKKREKEIINSLVFKTHDILLREYLSDFYEKIFDLSKKARILKKQKIKIRNVGIIGLGLIGGSIAKTLKYIDKEIKIFGFFEDKDSQKALKAQVIDKIFDLENMIENSEMIILSTPIEIITFLARKIKSLEKKLRKEILIIDTGSVKEKIVKEFEILSNKKIEFLGTHPMAGWHKTGFENSKIGLFINHPWIITPHKKNKKESIKLISHFVKSLGSKPLFLSSFEHDEITARISHFNYLLTLSLFAYVYKKNKNYLKYAGTGFKTLTRLVSSNPYMWQQIFLNNYKKIMKEKTSFLRFFKNFNVDEHNFLKISLKYKKIRDKFYEK